MSKKHIHTRQVICDVYYLDEGLWEIEGKLTDTKSHKMRLIDGRHLSEGNPVHKLVVRMVIDDLYMIKSIEIDTPSTPTSDCPHSVNSYRNLIGITIGKGFSSRVHDIVKRECGCTHLTEVIRQMAITVFQAIPIARTQLLGIGATGNDSDYGLMLRYKDTCYALRSGSAAFSNSEQR